MISNAKTLICRNLLYVPGSSEKMFHKALGIGVGLDTICFDLEDGVAENRKIQAKDLLSELIPNALGGSYNERFQSIFIRLNHPSFGHNDLNWFCSQSKEFYSAIDGIILPKITRGEEIDSIISEIKSSSSLIDPLVSSRLKVLCMIEETKSIVNLTSICSSGVGHLSGLIFGAEDFCKDSDFIRTPDSNELLPVRSTISIHAKAFGLEAIDMVCTSLKDNGLQLEKECSSGLSLGYSGKQIIHPSQIQPTAIAFSPSPEKVDQAKALLSAYEEHLSKGAGAFIFNGSMVDMPVIVAAQKLMAKASKFE